MIATSVFKNNQSRAVRIPKCVALDESVKKVFITVKGKSRIITPIENTWDDWFDAKGATEDFMQERSQESDTHRELR
ncbi:type II toxin-antitoxin system VapB family antitoxin [Thiomicrospira microaerophila]|uniref:type II toxin-antitoxin system VapB family antitoxin n=1 Tax=Thiomicrospira microaerophila TaxID=406020 RepID=UPI0005CAC4CB|nr:type II toxin-antitoxin system VapB family antitoxin [Thiomicrospira microaerophila]